MLQVEFGPKARSALAHYISYNIHICLDNNLLQFIHSRLNHHHAVCNSTFMTKFKCAKSIFAKNC